MYILYVHTHTHTHTHKTHTETHTHTQRHTHTHTRIRAPGLLVPPLRTTNPSRQWTWGRDLEREVLPTGSECQASVWHGGIPGFRWGYPLPRVKEVPSLPEARLRVPAHAAPPWGSPTRAVLRDPEPHPPDPAGASGEADGGWALRPAALGRGVCLLNPLSSAWSELPFPGGRRSPDPLAGLSLLGISVWPAHLVEQPREGQGSPSSGM